MILVEYIEQKEEGIEQQKVKIAPLGQKRANTEVKSMDDRAKGRTSY
jgi:hypothetical protein